MGEDQVEENLRQNVEKNYPDTLAEGAKK